jgi:hypothetical protein
MHDQRKFVGVFVRFSCRFTQRLVVDSRLGVVRVRLSSRTVAEIELYFTGDVF